MKLSSLKYIGAVGLLWLSAMLAAYPRYVSADAAVETKKTPAAGTEQAAAPGSAGSYLAARFAHDRGDASAASYYFSHSLGHNPYDENLMKQAIRTHVLAGRMEDAARVAENLVALYDGTQLSHLVLLAEGLRAGKVDVARQHLDKTDPYGLFSVIQPLLQAWVALGETGKPAPVPVSEHIGKLQVFDPLIAFQNALVFDAGGDNDNARTYYKQVAQDLTGTNYRVLLPLLNFYARQGEKETARAIFDQYVKENRASQLTDGLSFEQALSDAVRKDGKPFAANAAEGVAEALFALAGMLYGENVTTETQLYLQLALRLRTDMPDALLILGSIMEERGDAAQATAYLDRIAKGGPVYRRAQLRKAFLLSSQNHAPEALTLLKDLRKEFQASPDVLVAQGDVERKLSRFDRAAESYTQALELDGKKLQEHEWPILFARGISYERDGEWEKAEADFRAALELYPDQPDVLNYLGYSWLMKGTHLEKAKSMLEQAVAERPEDAHIIDSMGWALYLLADYNGALDYLEQAVNLMPSDPVVNDHYGDALWQVGRRNEARFQWERALYFGPESEEQREKIEAKLKSGLASTASPGRISAARN